MKKVVFVILFGFLLMFLRVFPVQGAVRGLSDASVAYADSVGISLEKSLVRQGYEPDGQRFAIQVSIALRYRLFQGDPVGDPVRVLAIREGDPMTLMVSQGTSGRGDEMPAESSSASVEPRKDGTTIVAEDSLAASTESPKDESVTAAGSPDDEIEYVGRKIGEFLAARGYTGAYAAIRDQATVYLKARPFSSEKETESIPVPIRIVKDGRIMTIEISDRGIEDGSFDSSRLVRDASPSRKAAVARPYGRKVRTKRITASVREKQHEVTVKTTSGKEKRTVFVSRGNLVPAARRKPDADATRTVFRDLRTHPYRISMKPKKISETASLSFRERLTRSLFGYRYDPPRSAESGPGGKTGPPRPVAMRPVLQKVLRN